MIFESAPCDIWIPEASLYLEITWSIVFLDPVIHIPLLPANSIIKYFTNWFEPDILTPPNFFFSFLTFLKLRLGYWPLDCFTPTSPPAFEPLSWTWHFELILITGVSI